MLYSKNINRVFIRFFILISAIGLLFTILISELLFHNFVSNNFIDLIQRTLNENNGYIPNEKIRLFSNNILYYSYFSMSISSIICLVFYVIFLVILSKKFIWPIKNLSKMVSKLTNNVYEEIDEKFPYEIDVLKEQFNNLSKKLKEQETLKKDIVLNVSHELKTPLTVIQGILEGSSDKIIQLDENNIQLMLNEIFMLKCLLNDMEDSVYNYKSSLCITAIDTAELVSDITNFFRNKCSLKEIKIYVSYNDLDTIFADKSKLIQVFNNIIENSIKYSPQGGSIHIKVYRSNQYQCISFKDTGYGIPPEDIPYIFERFYRGEKSRSRRTGGAGIGLSIVKNIIEAHAGLIDVESKLGEGTEIIIKIPYPVAS